jgi:hypothetical protein
MDQAFFKESDLNAIIIYLKHKEKRLTRQLPCHCDRQNPKIMIAQNFSNCTLPEHRVTVGKIDRKTRQKRSGQYFSRS